MFQENLQYEALVTSMSLVHSETTGNSGLQVRFKSHDTPVAHVLWLTEANRLNVYRALDALGAQDSQHFNPTTDLEKLNGHKCLLTFEMEEYEGKPRLRVKWINPLHRKIPQAAVASINSFFGVGHNNPPPGSSFGNPANGAPSSTNWGSVPSASDERFAGITDDDVPF